MSISDDPRVLAAKANLDAFMATSEGMALERASTGADWRDKMAKLSEDVKLRYEALSKALVTARRDAWHDSPVYLDRRNRVARGREA